MQAQYIFIDKPKNIYQKQADIRFFLVLFNKIKYSLIKNAYKFI